MDDNRKIRKLDDRQKSREKLPVWYGSVDNYSHGLKEVLANATDEITNNFEKGEITVTLGDDLKTLSVRDTGRGIPLLLETDGEKNYELLFETLFAGTKYDETNDNNTGVNGVGTTVLNYTSEMFEVDVRANGKRVILQYTDGGQDPTVKEEDIDKSEHGTTFTFRLDPTVYSSVVFTPDEAKEIARRYAVASNKITVRFIHKEEEEVFSYESLIEYYETLVGNTETSPRLIVPSTLSEEGDERTTVELVLSTTPEVEQEAYLNMTHLPNEGKINEGVIDGVTRFATVYAKANRLFPKNITSFNKNDIASSISFVITVLSNKVEFENQTKLSTDKKLYHKIVRQIVLDSLAAFEVENKDGIEKMIKHFLHVQKHNAANQRQRNQLRRQLLERVDGMMNKVDKFTDCDKHENSELYVAEGDSAGGSIILARDAEYQAVMSLRGKITNVLKASYPTIFDSQIILNLIKVLGCGVEGDRRHKDWSSFDKEKLRFQKIIIATDADADGAQIACLVLTCLYRLTPTLIKDGHIYIAKTPLYEVKMENDEMFYIYNEESKDKELAKIDGKYTISRVKGLGELEAEIMSETALDPETRVHVQVTVDDVKRMITSFDDWMGPDNRKRSEIIARRLPEFIEDVD